MKLTKAQAKAMIEVERLIALDRPLKEDERVFVLENFQESTGGNNALFGAFFTPQGLARDFSIEVPSCNTLVDLCAGIGALAFQCEDRAKKIVCVERNAEYVRIGRKVMPNATWIHADVFGDWVNQFDKFDCAISNPPFGNIKAAPQWSGKYSGNRFEYKVIELASQIARYGTFIVPQSSAPFRYSGQPFYREVIDAECAKFAAATSVSMGANAGIDTALFRNDWHGVNPICEIVTCDFEDMAEEVAPVTATNIAEVTRVAPALQMDLFAEAA